MKINTMNLRLESRILELESHLSHTHSIEIEIEIERKTKIEKKRMKDNLHALFIIIKIPLFIIWRINIKQIIDFSF